MANSWKEWEKPVLELEEGVQKLKELSAKETDVSKKAALEERVAEFEKRIENFISVRYSRLGPWEEVLLARAEPRPYTLDYVAAIFSDFVELDGDRKFGADHAIIAGPARLDGRPVMVVGHQKGRNIQERGYRNFAMAKPEGYRKAIRVFEMAERFRMPVVTFVDTPAADPGVESESRGISEAIAASMLKMFELTVPVVSVVIGEGGSGGAIGIAVANKVYMQQHAVYSVIPPEGCAAILWRDPGKKAQAAAALQLTSDSALKFGLVDEVLAEPFGGAHRDPVAAAATVKAAIERGFSSLSDLGPHQLREQRYARFRKLGDPV
ncbi:acetyl-CoA carboxylase carboxyltransferase subunit alpha [Kamptonema cortianum]|nr:acetyl-CoA carboxylase carboxyltransferase subunit alpha [Geitlerinema splendidum]MDK3158569.1 acetyl-CoA carboxylase carboxyltransferase subunit alpha [Kamptonema cortianum]